MIMFQRKEQAPFIYRVIRNLESRLISCKKILKILKNKQKLSKTGYYEAKRY